MLTFLAITGALVAVYVFFSYRYSAPDLSRYDNPEPPLIRQAADISREHQDVVKRLADYHAGPAVRDVTTARARFSKLFETNISFPVQAVDVDGIPGEWVVAPDADPHNRLLYLHGGAFVVGNPETHRFITSELSRRSGAAVLAIDYRKRPENKITACHEDARRAYDWIQSHGPAGPGPVENLFVAGDSAGGNLTLSLIAWARDNGRRAADGAITFAPSTDATMSSPTWKENLETDLFLAPSIGRVLKFPGSLVRILASLQSGRPINDPVLSPLLGNLGGLPPTLIQVSRHEMLFGDAQRYTNKAASEGSPVTLQVWPTLVHVFQGFENLPEAHEALDLAADFIRNTIKAKLERTRLM